MLDLNACRTRQERLLKVIADRKLDAIVCSHPAHVLYFTGFLTDTAFFQSAAIIHADGRTWLTTPGEPTDRAAADQIISYEAQWHATLRQEQPRVVAGQAIEALTAAGAKRIGVDTSIVNSQLILGFEGAAEAIDEDLWQMRRSKDPDELGLMRVAIRCTEAMYSRAKEIIEPGVDELHVYAELHAVAVKTAGEKLTSVPGNDYACGTGGGPPRKDRPAKDGELYILDLGPQYRGYCADNCRAFAVNGKPTDVQLEAWETIVEALRIVEGMARPGVSCRAIYDHINEHFKATRGTGMAHHLGHGVGLQPHEYPHLNPNWDDTLIEGEVFTAEPGQYSDELAGGIRIENQYVVTADSVMNLVNFPEQLV